MKWKLERIKKKLEKDLGTIKFDFGTAHIIAWFKINNEIHSISVTEYGAITYMCGNSVVQSKFANIRCTLENIERLILDYEMEVSKSTEKVTNSKV